MTKKELLEDKIFKMAGDDQEIMLESMGYHRPRRVRLGKTPRTGDRTVLIISNI